MRRFLWLASYPKSGNTWLRAFLNNLLADAREPVDINALDKTPLASTRELFDIWVGLESANLTPDQVDALRPEVYQRMADESRGTLFFKIHDALTPVNTGPLLVPPAATRGALYLIRNPLDVAVSFAHHGGWDQDTTIGHMNDPGFSFAGVRGQLSLQLRQRLSTWSGHVRSWTEAPPFPVEVLRYEDMKRDPQAALGRAARFAGLEASEEQIARAVRFSEFEVLREQEAAHGFAERSPRAKSFFRRGEAGAWKGRLSPEQIARLVGQHGEVMARFGYETCLQRLCDGEPAPVQGSRA